MTDSDVQVSESGGTMQRLTERAAPRPVDLGMLESERLTGIGAGWCEAGNGPFLEHGTSVQWCYGRQVEPMRVVRDDERGLVAWLAEDTELVAWRPADGRSLRELPLVDRFAAELVPTIGRWQGSGVLRIAPTARPWSVWLFWEDDGTFAGHYVNLELAHHRRAHETATRDLTLDLWLDPDGTLWLKDADELAAGVASGRYSAPMADEIRAVAEWAQADLVEAADWPLDEEWTTWRPPSDWTVPALPDTPLVTEARRTTLPR
ncbi:Protein of unknown function [Nocardioides alpinus]|uniref:DUF402 domain-containing protein n=1 Tax=Nocardioides alpinus TaxID=748909 RepID=A0A1I0ZTB8_9ACTN|nr:DUF402 domain-containing protein [Nocardioides alpinus]PKH41819.1 DUF402 domain-containing protein [Nocardioides alpinus]SFB28751.1 Protein of unknown function [Nocardioides alpinus]